VVVHMVVHMVSYIVHMVNYRAERKELVAVEVGEGMVGHMGVEVVEGVVVVGMVEHMGVVEEVVVEGHMEEHRLEVVVEGHMVEHMVLPLALVVVVHMVVHMVLPLALPLVVAQHMVLLGHILQQVLQVVLRHPWPLFSPLRLSGQVEGQVVHYHLHHRYQGLVLHLSFLLLLF